METSKGFGMRQGGGPNNRRPRGRHHSGGGGSGGGGFGGGNGGPPSQSGPMMSNNRPRSAASLRHQTFDSNGPDVRVRGNAWQVYEKYQSLARDATTSGDRVGAENYQQHAEHYYRIIEAINDATALEQQQSGGRVNPSFNGADGQQPEVPQNYYSPAGGLAQPAPASAPVTAVPPSGNTAPSGAPDVGEVSFMRVSTTPKQSTFVMDESSQSEEQASSQPPLLATR